MPMRLIYLVLMVVSTVTLYFFMIRYSLTLAEPFSWTTLRRDVFSNDLATFLVLDLLCSVVIFILFMTREAKRLAMRRQLWICLVVLFGIGLCAAFPLFMYYRESALQHNRSQTE